MGVLKINGGRRLLQVVRLQPRLGLDCEVEVVEQVWVVGRVGDRVGRLWVDLAQVLLPQVDHLARLGWQVGASQEGGLGRTAGRDEQVHAGLRLTPQQRAHEGNVELALLLCQRSKAVDALGVPGRGVQQKESAEVSRPHQALLRQAQVGGVKRHVTELLPARLGRLLLRDCVGSLQLAQLHGQLELMLRIRRNCQRLLLEALRLEESRDAVVLRLRDGGEQVGGGCEVAADDGRLVLEHRQQQLVRDDGKVSVEQVDAVVLWQVAHDVQRPVQVLQGNDLAADGVVEPAGLGRVDQALRHPHARPNLVGDLVHELKGVVDAFLTNRRARLERNRGRLAVVPEQEERIVADQRHHVARVAPLDLARLHVHAPHQPALGPVEEEGYLSGADAEERSAVDGVGLERRLEGADLLEVLEELDRHWRLANRVVSALSGPHKVERRAEGPLAPRERRVDDVLSVAAHDGESAVGVARQPLRVDLAHVELLGGQTQPLAIDGGLGPRVRLFDVDACDLVVLGQHEFTRRVHRRDGLLVPQLNHNRALIVGERHVVAALQRGDGPATLVGVVEVVLLPVRVGVPDAHGAVLGAGHDDGQLGVAADGRHIVRVALHRLDALLRLVVPHLDCLVVRARDEVRSVAPRKVLDAVDALLMPLQREVRLRRVEAPDLDGAVERSGGERICVLRVEGNHHNVVRVALERHRVDPVLLPVPQPDCHIIRG
mmetsp:Transcript_1572/g.5077  ORF Transcript_1572/g.5077 Transcript_1572/m.5077 type:complete len:716 (-) Transcript_1572:422-2569(-)